MKRIFQLIAVTAMSTSLLAPTLAAAQNIDRNLYERRHDQQANQGFATSRNTTRERTGGYVSYRMGYPSNSRMARSSDEAEKQFRRGGDAYAAGDYGLACRSYKHAKNLYARVGDTQMSEASATLANDTCSTARANG